MAALGSDCLSVQGTCWAEIEFAPGSRTRSAAHVDWPGVAIVTEGNSPPAIVAGLDTIAGIQVARILGERGVPIVGIAADRRHYSCYTRACGRVVEADTAGIELIEALEQLAAAGDPGVVIPCTDQAVFVLARNRDRVEPAHSLPVADLGVLEALGDKACLASHAARERLPVPRTIVLEGRGDAERAARSLEFPCALKPATRTGAWLRETGRKGFRLESPRELLETYERVRPWADRLVAQEWIPGDERRVYIFRGYYDRTGQPLVTFMNRNPRKWPLQTGIGVSGEECRNDVALGIAMRLFGAVGHYGFAMLEVKHDARTGEHIIVEANPGRPTVQTGISERGGVEFLYTAYCDALGRSLPANREQRYVGTKFVFLRDDLRAALALRRQGRLSLRAWLRSLRGPRAFAVFSPTDPLPFLVDLVRSAWSVLRSVPVRRGHRRPPPGSAASR